MKKKLAATLSVVLILGLAVLGILAYLTDTDKDVNVMTLGNVDITQHEQQVGEDGELEPFEQGKGLYPGKQNEISKVVTVENTGESDCYFRTLIAFESIESETFGNGFEIFANPDGSYNGDYEWSYGNRMVVEIDGVNYDVWEAIYTKPLPVGETSSASLVNTWFNDTCTNEDMEALGGTYEILVLSQAIQTEGFDTAKDALDTGFGAFNEANVKAWFTGTEIPTAVATADELATAIADGKDVYLTADVKIDETLTIAKGTDVHLNMNGKTITVDDSDLEYAIYSKMGSTLTIDGNGTFELGKSGMAFIIPCGDVTIENGTFVRDMTGIDINGKDVYPLISGTKYADGLGQMVINGGYFDGGYYDANADFSKFNETDKDIANRGKSADKNLTRVAIKNNIIATLNLSAKNITVKGGTFVGMNPAWGDEGCALPTEPDYLRPWSYYQGTFIEGQQIYSDRIELPEGYSVTEGTTADGIPTYTLNYNK